MLRGGDGLPHPDKRKVLELQKTIVAAMILRHNKNASAIKLMDAFLK